MANDMTGFPSNRETLKTVKLCSLSLVPQSEVKRRMGQEWTGLQATCTELAAGKCNYAELTCRRGNMR